MTGKTACFCSDTGVHHQIMLCSPVPLRICSVPTKRAALVSAYSLKVYVPAKGTHSWPWYLHAYVRMCVSAYVCTCVCVKASAQTVPCNWPWYLHAYVTKGYHDVTVGLLETQTLHVPLLKPRLARAFRRKEKFRFGEIPQLPMQCVQASAQTVLCNSCLNKMHNQTLCCKVWAVRVLSKHMHLAESGVMYNESKQRRSSCLRKEGTAPGCKLSLEGGG